MPSYAPQTDHGEGPAAAAGFTAATSQGEQVPVPGSKPSVLFFFSIECGACGPGTRMLAEVQRSSPAAVNYVAVDIAPYETADEIKEFLAGNGASSLAFASDTDTRLITAYGINQVSTAVVLDAAGTEVFRAVEPDAAELRTALAAAGAD
ncbi:MULTISPECIES: thioredoxin-like domain-containing protein [unclassified Arthrobacter]|uniref:TlpA family protein disulfide reductase n=1 Tax=unclassified Arthrobacter TaxID=235627 RepID=UPI00196A8F26|nr:MULTISPECIES: thioredoxin-like domain-containing protein [unclassified Arthrobacter]